jgi:hypothetical protein
MTDYLDPATLTPEGLYKLQSETWAQGAEAERERIIKLLEPLAQHDKFCNQGCYPEDCSAPSYEYAIELIKGEQK